MKKTIWILLILLMAFNFLSNFFRITDNKWYREWQIDSEALVVGRLIESNNNGVFSKYGLLGSYGETATDVFNQKSFYYNNKTKGEYDPYLQQVGLQGMAFGLLDKISPLSNHNNLRIFYVVNCILLSVIFVFICFWIYKQFGLGSAVLVYLILFFSPWIIVSARNLYWVLWTFFLPMALQIYLFEKYEKNKLNIPTNYIILTITFLSILLKCLCGYEFITTVLISIEIPLIYYSIKNKWNFKKYFKSALAIGISGLLGFLSAIMINLTQVTLYYKDFSKAFYNLIYTVSKRTSAFNVEVDYIYQESLKSSYFGVLKEYLFEGKPIVGPLRAYFVIVILVILVVIYLKWLKKFTSKENNQKIKALLYCTAISFLAPLSWYILAKAHSYIHIHINYLLWSMPFTIFAFAFIGYVSTKIIEVFNNKRFKEV